MNAVTFIGQLTVQRWNSLSGVTALICGTIRTGLRPRCWPRTVRELFVKQILFTAVDALNLITFIAVLSGISIVTQAQVWLTKLGQSAMLGSILVAIIVGGIGPLLVNLVVIGRSGTAIATELANMKVRGETDVLDAQGVDHMIYLIMPRILGTVLSVLCLTIFFCAISLLSGYVFGMILGITKGDFHQFLATIANAVSPADVLRFLAKTVIPGLLTGAICCIEGLNVQGAITEVPQAATRAVVGSIAAMLVVIAVVSVL